MRLATYVNEDLYDELTREGAEIRDEIGKSDPGLRNEVESLLFREARLLDGQQFDQWLSLFTEDCIYWMPTDPEVGDPRASVSIAFDDHRRLEDRIVKLKTGWAHSQTPISRTSRLVGNVETWRPRADTVRVRSTFVLNECRHNVVTAHAGWYAHVLVAEAGEWRIRRKIITLVNSDSGFTNISFFF